MIRKLLSIILPADTLGIRQISTAPSTTFLPLPAKDDPHYQERMEEIYSQLRSLTKATGIPEHLPPHLGFAFYSTTDSAAYRRQTIFSPHTLSPLPLKDITPVIAEYFAGLIDGDGHIRINITPSGGKAPVFYQAGHLYNEALLLKLAEYLGGTVGIESAISFKTTVTDTGVEQQVGPLASRYWITAPALLYTLAILLNGRSMNSIRTPQVHSLLIGYEIAIKNPSVVTLNNAWALGIFDSDGSIGLSGLTYPLLWGQKKASNGIAIQDVKPGLLLSVSQLYPENLENFLTLFPSSTIQLGIKGLSATWHCALNCIEGFIVYCLSLPIEPSTYNHRRLALSFKFFSHLKALSGWELFSPYGGLVKLFLVEWNSYKQQSLEPWTSSLNCEMNRFIVGRAFDLGFIKSLAAANQVTVDSINDKLHFLGDNRNNWTLSEELYCPDNKNHLILTGRYSKEARIGFVNCIVASLLAKGVIQSENSLQLQLPLPTSVPWYLCIGAKVSHGLYYYSKTNSFSFYDINSGRATLFLSLFESHFERIINDLLQKNLEELGLDLSPIAAKVDVLAKQIASTPIPSIETYPNDSTMGIELVNGSFYNGRYQSHLFIKNHELFEIAKNLAVLNKELDSIKLLLTEKSLHLAISQLVHIIVAIPDTKLLDYIALIKNSGGHIPAEAFAIISDPLSIQLGKSILNKGTPKPRKRSSAISCR